MKSLKIAITALVIAGGTFGAFAFTKATTEKANNKKADLYWFDTSNNYLGQRSQSSQQTLCGPTGVNLCARGYSSIDIDENGDEHPVGTEQDQTSKQ